MKMLLTLAVIIYADYVAFDGLQSGDKWTYFSSWVWLLLFSLAVGLGGALQALGWVACESAWADPRSGGGIQKGLEVLGGKHGFSLAAASLLRLLSGACLLFAGLTLVLKYGIESGRIDGWPVKLVQLLLIHWFRLAALGLAAAAWAPILLMIARSAILHAVLAMLGSAVAWWAMWDLLKAPSDDFWQVAIYLMSWFPTYGCALLWGGALWWLPSRLAGKKG